MGPVKQLQPVLKTLAFRPQSREEGLDALAVGSVVVPFAAHIDMVGLHIEYELVFGPFFRVRLLVLHFSGIHRETVAEDLVECEQGCGHAAAGAKKGTPAQPLAMGGPIADLGQPCLVFLLLRRLRRRDELLIGDNPRRDR